MHLETLYRQNFPSITKQSSIKTKVPMEIEVCTLLYFLQHCPVLSFSVDDRVRTPKSKAAAPS